MKVLGIGGSPRKGGNTDILLEKCMQGAKDAGAETEVIFARDLEMSGCRECNACSKTGVCAVKDGMSEVFGKFARMDALVIAAPVFFYSVPSGLKAVIDRCQSLWAQKYVLKKAPEPSKKGLFISVGGTRGENLFSCVSLTMKYFFDVVGVKEWDTLFMRKIDAKAEILKYPDKLGEAYDLGRKLAAR